MPEPRSYRKATQVPCPQCGTVRELLLYGAWERERAFARKCWACRTGKPGEHFRKRGVADGRGDRPLPAEPTTAEPGSEEKLAVMAARAAAGEQPHHPGDARIEHGPARVRFLAAGLERLAARAS